MVLLQRLSLPQYEFESRKLNFEPEPNFYQPDIYTSTLDKIVALANDGDLGDLILTNTPISRLGISRGITVKDPSFPGYFFDIGGIGVVSMQNGVYTVKTPDPSIELEQYITTNLPSSYTGMRTAMVLPDGTIRYTPNSAPLGGYRPRSAIAKFKNTQTAQVLLAKQLNHVITPQPLAVLTDNQNDLSIFVSVSPSYRNPSEIITMRNSSAYEYLIYLMSRGLYLLHENDYVHLQAGSNWAGNFANKKFTAIWRDWSTLYSIAEHDKSRILDEIFGEKAIQRYTAHQLARFHDITHFYNVNLLLLERMLEMGAINKDEFNDLSISTAASVRVGYNPKPPKANLVSQKITDLKKLFSFARAKSQKEFDNLIYTYIYNVVVES